MSFSPRQVEIITLIGRDGLTYEQVGEQLEISKHTVRAHVQRLVDRGRFDERNPRDTLIRLYYEVVREGNGEAESAGAVSD